MKTISVRKAKKMMCPVCGSVMEFSWQAKIGRCYQESSTHGFNCKSCGVRWTAWDLVVKGLDKEYEKVYKEQVKIIKEESKRKVIHEPSCEKCGRIYCDCESKY